MNFTARFGTLEAGPRKAAGGSFRIAVMGDFSGRAARGVLESGAKLAARKALRVDVDNLDDVLARLKPAVLVPMGDEGTVEVPIGDMEAFHPDQLVESLPLFEELLRLRKGLLSKAGFDRAAKQVLGWAGAEPLPKPRTRRARGGAVATDRRLDDFARLTGRTAVAEASTEELMRRLVGPFIVPARDSRQDALVARVDEALSEAMRRLLHSPEFQSAEALWRGLEMLVRRLDTGARLQVVLYDVSAEELAADLASTEVLGDTALYSMLVEQPALDADAGALSFVAGLYGFELSPPHAELLGRLAQLAAVAGAPAVVGLGPDGVLEPAHEWHPLVRSAWDALRALPAASYLGLASPRFLLRMPYGKKTDPIDAFAFEEFTRQGGLGGMLWGNPALLLALLAGETWLASGKAMKLGSKAVVGELAVYVFRDADGDQVALPCTERLFTERLAGQVAAAGVIPVVSLRGRPEVRVAGFGAVGGGTLAGRWAPKDVSAGAAASAAAPAVEAAAEEEAEPELAEAAEPDAAEEEAAAAPAAEDDLDALLAGLDAPAPATAEAAAEDDLDALLASLSAEPEAAAADETEADLDALLASLK